MIENNKLKEMLENSENQCAQIMKNLEKEIENNEKQAKKHQ